MQNFATDRLLLDGSWWLGGNRQRGIGKYLEYLFLHWLDSPTEHRYWYFPRTLSNNERNEFLQTFAGVILEDLPGQDDTAQLDQWHAQHHFTHAFISSPFERPWSFLSLTPWFSKQQLPWSAVIFDLIPLDFPQEVLATWPSQDQQQYRSQVSLLTQAKHLFCISPATKQSVSHHFPKMTIQSSVLEFGMHSDWLTIPHGQTHVPPTQRENLVVTISGGEWRKNLVGTLEYFAHHYPADYRLIVICKLGIRLQLAFMAKALRLGILNRVAFVGEVSEEQKWHYLFKAQEFLFLSRAEGLGIPLLEASKALVPTIVISPELKAAQLDQLVASSSLVKVAI